MSLPQLTTKLYIPAARADGVSRPRLTDKLKTGLRQPGSFALLSGPAGFGKTTLLSEFAAALEHPVAWLSLEEGDNDPIRFWTYLIAAIQTVQPGIGSTVMTLLSTPQPPPAEAVPVILINELSQLDRDLVLVLDDYHAIHSENVHAGVQFLLEHLPSKLHLVVSTRVDPPWPLARFRARGLLVEVRAQDLRFTIEEAAAFLNRLMGLDLSPEAVLALEERTEGWAAGLQLAALSMQGRSDIAGFIKVFTGSHVYIADYLVEEVLQRQPEDTQKFLLETSILERLCAGLCEAVTGCVEGQSMLLALYKTNLFVVSLDDVGQWFRYHHLFADLLKARLSQSLPPSGVASLHQRAAAWYEHAGMTSEAIEHAVAAGDYPRVVQLVEKVALPTILQAYVRTVEGWLQALPPVYYEKNPRINMAFAWLNLLRGSFDQAEPYIKQLEAIFSVPGAYTDDPSLQGEWLAIQSKLLNLQGKAAESRDLANRALQILPLADAHVRSMLLVNLAAAYEQILDYDKAAETYQLIARDAQASGNYVLEILGISGEARMVLEQGQLHTGFEIAAQGIKRLEASGTNNPFGATLFGETGQIYYQWHQLDKARSYLLRSAQVSGQSGYSDPEIYRHVMLSKMAQMEGDWDNAAQEMRQAGDLMRRIPPAMIRENIIAQQIRVDLALDHLSPALEALKAEGFMFDGELGFPGLATDPSEPAHPVTHPAGLLYNSALRLLLYQANKKHDLDTIRRGLEMANRVLSGELKCQQLPVALETLLLRSQMYTALGDAESSLADLARALELAEPERFISIFVEEGPPIAEALVTLLKRNLIGHVGRDYVHDILAAFPQAQPSREAATEHSGSRSLAAKQPSEADESSAPVEPLTARELEILQLIADGDSNRAIAEKLVITVSAVKKHTANIYGKLSVNSRTQAVARARQIGLLLKDE